MSSVSALNSLLASTSSSTTINLSQILQAATGASTPGIDVTAAVSAAVTAAQAPETAWENQETTLQNQTAALNQLQTDTTNLDNDMQSLNNLTGPLSARTVSSSDSTLVTASAASGSAVGNHTVVVGNLAATASWSSSTVSSATTPLAAGSFTITDASGNPTIISTGTGSSTLSDVANTINSDNLGVTANVITDATGARLAIVSNTSGSAANFSVTAGSGGLGFTRAVDGANASVTVDGITLSSASNTVTGALPGVTLNLLNASPGTNVSLTIAPDTSQASTAINQFVTDYNKAIGDVNTQFTDTGSGEGVLADDSAVRSLQSTLQEALDYTYTPASGTTTVPTLTAMGISLNSDGTLSVDSGALTSTLQNNFNDVQNFFQGASLNGFANSVDQQLTSFISPADGAFTVDLSSISTQISGLQTDVTNFQTNYIVPLQAQLQSEYSQAEILLQQLPQEMQQINTELGLNNNSSSGG
ncbi:MAG TPA: flagellar filament capping protein FliD [Acidobacteriaceae bacterium]|jgi:flagellar hook-associated protein 2|nr:flagellar filament capping protein FliD [Acidobacteriaceae bacterium]